MIFDYPKIIFKFYKVANYSSHTNPKSELKKDRLYWFPILAITIELQVNQALHQWEIDGHRFLTTEVYTGTGLCNKSERKINSLLVLGIEPRTPIRLEAQCNDHSVSLHNAWKLNYQLFKKIKDQQNSTTNIRRLFDNCKYKDHRGNMYLNWSWHIIYSGRQTMQWTFTLWSDICGIYEVLLTYFKLDKPSINYFKSSELISDTEIIFHILNVSIFCCSYFLLHANWDYWYKSLNLRKLRWHKSIVTLV